MDQNVLFSACRLGNLERIQILVEERDVDLNVRDMWDSTPLYYACLCGHKDVVEYLLENGARCEVDTFDGERAVYGALTQEIRQLLVQHKALTSQTIRRNPYEEFLRLLWDKQHETETYSDITFNVHGELFAAHRCILAARSEYFREHLAGKWKERTTIMNNHPLVDPAAFRAVLQYIYTGRLEIQVALVDDCIRLAEQFKLPDLTEKLRRQKSDIKFFVSTKFGNTRITTLVVEPQAGYHNLHHDLGLLAKHALPPRKELILEETVVEDYSDWWSHLSDVTFVVEGNRCRCHKAFLANRSEYFRGLLNNHFQEIVTDQTGVPVVSLHDVSFEAFSTIIYYIYQDFAEISLDHVMEVLYTAELYLLPGLKKQCGAVIAENLETHDVVEILRIARRFQLPRLESACVEFIARNLEKIVDNVEFSCLVKDDAKEVAERQDTDTIDVIDDIRYFITSNVQTYSQMDEAKERLLLIDKLLEELNLDA